VAKVAGAVQGSSKFREDFIGDRKSDISASEI
jgi:hypothetical protein